MNRLALLALLPLFHRANAQEPGHATVFTTLHSVRMDLAFGSWPAAGTKYTLLVMDGRTGRLVYREPATPLKEKQTLRFYANGLDVDAWTPTNPHL